MWGLRQQIRELEEENARLKAEILILRRQLALDKREAPVR